MDSNPAGALSVLYLELPRCSIKRRQLTQFGNRVRELRKSQGFSQESFAAEVGLDRTYVGGIERGERNIALLNICKIAKTLGVSLGDLLNFKP